MKFDKSGQRSYIWGLVPTEDKEMESLYMKDYAGWKIKEVHSKRGKGDCIVRTYAEPFVGEFSDLLKTPKARVVEKPWPLVKSKGRSGEVTALYPGACVTLRESINTSN